MGIFSGRRPNDLGVRNGLLKPVPASPNAVNSQATGGYHRIEPLRYNGTFEPAMSALKSVIESTPRTSMDSNCSSREAGGLPRPTLT